MRITPDTGILVRMNAKATGPARRLLEVILAGPHDLVLSEFLLDETARALRYPRLQNLYKLTPEDIDEHIQRLRGRADLVSPIPLWREEPTCPALWIGISMPLKSSPFVGTGALNS